MCVRERIPLGALLKLLFVVVVFPRARRVLRGSKLLWFRLVLYLVGVGGFGYVQYSTSPELAVLVAFGVPPRRS